MIQRPFRLLYALLLVGTLLAGCGGGSSSSTTTTTTQHGSSPSTSTSGGAAGLSTQRRAEACKQSIKAPSAGAKAKLEALCEKAAHASSETGEQKARREACEAPIKKSALLSSSAKAEALATCKPR